MPALCFDVHSVHFPPILAVPHSHFSLIFHLSLIPHRIARQTPQIINQILLLIVQQLHVGSRRSRYGLLPKGPHVNPAGFGGTQHFSELPH